MSKMQSVYKKFLSHRDGLAVMEFALVLPLLMVVFLGMITVFDTYKGFQRASLASGTLADLTTRLPAIDHDRMTSLLGAGEAMLGKYGDDGAFKINISSVSNITGDEDDYDIDWSETYASRGSLDDIEFNEDFELTIAALEALDIPAIPFGESLIIVRTELTFAPFFMPEPIKMQKIAIRNPRFVSRIDYDDDD